MQASVLAAVIFNIQVFMPISSRKPSSIYSRNTAHNTAQLLPTGIMQTLTHLDHILSLSTGGANEISRNAFYILYIAYKHIPASKQIKRVFHNLKIGFVSTEPRSFVGR